MDANTEALNKHLNLQQEAETQYERFLDFIDDDLVELNNIKDKIKKLAENYNGYDFSDEIEEVING